MNYIIKEDTKTKALKIRPKAMEESDWGQTEIIVYPSQSSKNHAKYCRNCDTWYLLYKSEVGGAVEQIQKDGKVVFVEEKKNCSQAQYLTATKNHVWKSFFGGIGNYFIVSIDYHIEDYKKYEVNRDVRCDFTTVDTYAFSDEYLKSRKAFDRIEIADEKETHCRICGAELIDGISACSLLMADREEQVRHETMNYVEIKSRSYYGDKYAGDKKIDLAEFIKKLIEVESSLKYLIERKVVLTIGIEDVPKMKRKADGRRNYDNASKLKEKKRELDVLSPDYLSEEVIDDELGLKKPDEPMYEKPSFFTKKKVEENKKKAIS